MHKILSLFCALCMFFSFAALPAHAEEPGEEEDAQAGTYGSLTYEISNGEVTITGCDQYTAEADIPEEIEGYPVTGIGRRAFQGRKNITKIRIPDTVTHIDGGAFYNCVNLADIRLPERIEKLDCYGTGTNCQGMFGHCESLTAITIPDSVTYLGSSAFAYCYNLQEAELSGSLQSFPSSSGLSSPPGMFEDCGSLTSLTIPNGINLSDHSRQGAFHNCVNLKTAGMVGSDANIKVKNIGNIWNVQMDAFYDTLTEVAIPVGVTEICGGAFSDCSRLTSVSIPDGVVNIGPSVFYECAGLTEITLPDSVRKIGENAFGRCFSLKRMDIPDGVTEIPSGLFDLCSNLTTVTVPDSVTGIGDGAFYNCRSLTAVHIPDGVTGIGICTFYNCIGLTEISLPDSVTSIQDGAFSSCTGLTGIDIPDDVTTIGEDAFGECTGLTSVTIPAAVQQIGIYAFHDCSALKEVWLDHSLDTVDVGVFYHCNDLETVYYHGTEAEWKQVTIENNNEPLLNAEIVYLIPVESIRLRTDSVEMEVGETFDLKLSICPEDVYMDDVTVSWEVLSGQSNIRVDSNGRITALQEGSALVQVSVADRISRRTFTAECSVMVYPSDQVKSFVRRLYRLCFGRDADTGGLNSWVTKLKQGTSTAAQVIQAFFTGREMQNLHLSDDEFVERCYLVMMNRESDPGGKRGWIGKLDAGVSNLYVLKGFVGSREFKAICAEYGLTVGEIRLTEARDQNLGITQFVSRCYSEVLGRKGDAGGLNNWCKKILSASDQKNAAIGVATNSFFHSTEFRNRNTTNEQFVTICYRTFLGRDPDTGGYNNWLKKLNSGTPRDSVMMGFANSKEFANIMAKYGIK